MNKLYAVYANGSLMQVARGGAVVVGSEERANRIKEAFETVSEIRGEAEQTDYEVVPYVWDAPTKDYAEQGVAPKPTDFMAGVEIAREGISADAYMYACKHFGMNPVEINKVRSSKQWAEIVELAKKHSIGVAEVENPHNFCEYINTPERPWNVKIDPDNECNLTPVPGVKPQLSKHTGDEVENMLNEDLRKKIANTSSKVPTKEVWGIYSRDDKPETSEFHRDGQHVLFLTQKMANDYVNRIANFVEFGVFSRKKMVPITTKVIGDGLS